MATPLPGTRSRAWVGALLPLALLAGCGEDTADTGDVGTTTEARDTMGETPGTTADGGSADTTTAPDDAGTTATAPVTVTASAEVGSPTLPGLDPSFRGLLVTYEVSNGGDAPLLVARDRGHGQHTASRAPANDESVWVEVVAGAGPAGEDAGEGEVLRLAKEIHPLPEGALEEERETRLATDLLAPGDTLAGTAFVPAPVRPDHPRHGDAALQPETPLETLPDRWQLCLSIAPDDGRDGLIGRLTDDRSVVCSTPAPMPEDL